MPTLTITREAPLELIRQCPDLAVDLVRAMTGVPLPADPKADLGPTGLNAVVPAEFTADAVVVVTDRATGAPALVIVVEPQGREDKTKAYSWPTYLAIVQEAVQCPSAVLLVVCPGPREADKCRQVIKMGHPGWDLYPIVIDPAHAPAGDGAGRYLPRFEFLLDDLPGVGKQQLRDRPLTAPAQITLLLLKIAADNPRLAADLAPWAGQLRSIAGQPGGTETLVALLTYIERVSEVPVGELHDLAASLGPEAKEAYVTTAEMLRAEGAAKGAAETKAQDVLKVIDARNLGPTREQRAMVTGDAGLDKLNRWFDRVLTAADVFKGDED
jgi:hypothetical protein